MLGTRTDLKDKIKAGRQKAAGLKRTGPAGKARIAAAPVDSIALVPEVDDLEAEELPSEEELAAKAAAAKLKAKIAA